MLIGAAFLPTFHIDYYTSITFDNVKTVEIAFIFMIYHHTIVLRTKSKFYSPSTLNIDLILWHTHLIVQ